MHGERVGSGLLLIDPKGRLLLQQRDDDHPPAGYGRWAIPGGTREGDETPLENALREFEEETTVRLHRVRFFETFTPETVPGLHATRLDLFFADDDVPRSRITVHEGLDFQYFAPAEISALSMNPPTRAVIERFLADDKYLGTVAMKARYRVGACVLELDRWGRVLLQLRDHDLPPERFPGHWSLPGGLLHPGEAPDAAALREFEEETGVLLEELHLFRVYRRDPDLPSALVDVQHVFFVDADLDVDLLDVNEGEALQYVAPGELDSVLMPPHTATILSEFFSSPAYRALFH